jgi:hypothetical protein
MIPAQLYYNNTAKDGSGLLTAFAAAACYTNDPQFVESKGACSNANTPFNCPMIALPWANDLTLSNLNYVGSRSYSGQGVNINQLRTP